MTAPTVSTDPRSTVSGTRLDFVFPAHDDNASAAVAVLVAGNVTGGTPPAGWVEQTNAYQAAADATLILWTADGAIPATDTGVSVTWVGTARAAGVLAFSNDTQGVAQIGAVTADATATNTGTAAGVTTTADDELPVVFGGTADVDPTSDRYPDLGTVSLAELTTLAYTDSNLAGIDAWALHGTGFTPAGPTGPVTWSMLGTGVTADPTPITYVGATTFTSGDANEASGPIDVALPAGTAAGDTLLIGATGQPPDVSSSTPAVDHHDETDTAGAAATAISVPIPAGHIAKTAVVELVTEGNAGTITAPAGWTPQGAVTGVVAAWSKTLTAADEDAGSVDLSWTTARVARAQLLIIDGTLAGFHSTNTLANTAHPYGPHTSPQQTADAASLHLLTWTTLTAAATPSSTTDAHTITVNPLPVSHTYETAYGTDTPAAAGVNPTGTATMAAATDGVTNSWIFDPRPQNPTNLQTPAGFAVVHARAGAGDAPSTYVFAKIATAADVTAGTVTVAATSETGEFAGILAAYTGGNTATILDAAAVTNGPAYNAAPTSPAVATVTDQALEVAFVLGTDHGAPSHADSTVTAVTYTVANDRAAVLDPSGSFANLFDETRATAGAGTARSGTVTNGLANDVNHEVIGFALRPADQTGSRQVTQIVTFAPAVDQGPVLSWPTPQGGNLCVTDPVLFSGSAADPAGVGTVTVQIVRQSDGQYWNGAAWQVAATSVTATLGTPGGTSTTWSTTVTGAFVTPGRYTATVAATNNATPTATRTQSRSICVAGATATQLVRQAKLGDDPTITVEIVGRYGGTEPDTVIARLPAIRSRGYFDRRLDSPSQAEVETLLTPLDLVTCCENLAQVDTWACCLRITWDGPEAWYGPITYIRFGHDRVYLKAQDLSIHWQTRVLGEYHYENTDLAVVFQRFHQDAYDQDPWGMDVIAQNVGVTGKRDVVASHGVVAWSAISELTRTGVDYTVVGRTMLIGGEEVPTHPITTLRDDHFREPLTVVDDGVLRATDSVVSGLNEQISGRVELPATNPRRRRYGLITNRAQERQINDNISAGQAAQTRLDFMQDSIRVEPQDGATLTAAAPISMVDLIPGARIDLNAAHSCRPTAGQFRLERVTARFDGSVSVDVQPLGTTGA